MANKSSAALTARDGVPSQTNSNAASTKVASGRLKESIGVIAVDNAEAIASVLRFFSVHSSWRISELLLYCTAITTCAGDIGLYDLPTVNAGAAVDSDLFATAQALSSALDGTSVLREATTITVANLEKPVWVLLGLTADPGKWYDVAITLTAAAGSTGNIALKGRFIDGN